MGAMRVAGLPEVRGRYLPALLVPRAGRYRPRTSGQSCRALGINNTGRAAAAIVTRRAPTARDEFSSFLPYGKAAAADFGERER